MIKHIFKNFWGTRGNSIWILLEIFVVSVFLWYSLDYLYTQVINLNRPLGYDYTDVYQLKVGVVSSRSYRYNEDSRHTNNVMDDFLLLLDRLEQHPLVESVCCTRRFQIYQPGASVSSVSKDTMNQRYFMRSVTPSYFDVFKVELLSGRLSEDLRIQATSKDVICTEDIARQFFGSSAPLGESIVANRDTVRIIDVCKDQKWMDYSGYISVIYSVLQYNTGERMGVKDIPDIYFRVKEGVGNKDFIYDFRKEMGPKLTIGNLYLHQLKSLSSHRKNMIREASHKFNLYISVICFFLINIFLGVLGTFWFRTHSRRHEIGLRLALGSSRRQIFGLLTMENLFMVGVAFLPAVVVCFHIQYAGLTLDYPIEVSGSRFFIVQGMTFALIIGIALLGSWFPVRKASATPPAEVLHEE